MAVSVDERVALIREVLPGANCGACGFAGCDDYAAALGSDSDVAPNLCPPGGTSVAAQIAENIRSGCRFNRSKICGSSLQRFMRTYKTSYGVSGYKNL